MKLNGKILVALVLILVTVCSFVLIGCDSNTIVVATNADFPPFETVDQNGKIVGFDIDFINAIGNKIGKKIKIMNVDFDSVLTAVSSGKAQVAIAGMTANDERKKHINFTTPYYSSTQVLIVKSESTKYDNITNVDDLLASIADVTANVAAGQIGHYFIEGNELFGYDKVTVKEMKLHASMLLACTKLAGDDVAVGDIRVAEEVVSRSDGKYKIINIKLTEEVYGIGVNKKETDLLSKINEAIVELDKEGEIAKLKEKWKVN